MHPMCTDFQSIKLRFHFTTDFQSIKLRFHFTTLSKISVKTQVEVMKSSRKWNQLISRHEWEFARQHMERKMSCKLLSNNTINHISWILYRISLNKLFLNTICLLLKSYNTKLKQANTIVSRVTCPLFSKQAMWPPGHRQDIFNKKHNFNKHTFNTNYTFRNFNIFNIILQLDYNRFYNKRREIYKTSSRYSCLRQCLYLASVRTTHLP